MIRLHNQTPYLIVHVFALYRLIVKPNQRRRKLKDVCIFKRGTGIFSRVFFVVHR